MTGDRLSMQARQLVGDPESELSFSAASIWEVAIKYGRGRDIFRVDPRVLRQALLGNLYQRLRSPVSARQQWANLPALHRDPFDRILLAQSIVKGIMLLTTDPAVAQYPAPVRRV